jgi:hydroxymethylglutaryl-CoA lyase
MTSLPKRIDIREEGPREGFQIEKTIIPTARKIEFIDALSRTGLKTIQIVSFVSPKTVPNMADAEDVVAGITMQPGVSYTGLFLNDKGFQRAHATGRLTLEASIVLCASDAFLRRNQNRTAEQQLAAQHESLSLFARHQVAVESAVIMAAFGCNFQGDVPLERIAMLADTIDDLAVEHGLTIRHIDLMDTMAWATPDRIKRAVGALQDKYPDIQFGLHLHDTRGLGLANAHAGLEMGIARFDACVGGLGGCPFAGHAGAAGNVCTEDLVFICEEMGIETGLDLEALIECARLAQDIVGHPLPGSVMTGGGLQKLRRGLDT